MTGLLTNNSYEILKACITSSKDAVKENIFGAKLTLAALVQFEKMSVDKVALNSDTKLKSALVKTGAYYFGPMFVLDKGTCVPNKKILKELNLQGFYTKPLEAMNNAQLNLFFITIKCRGIVSDRSFVSFIKYGVA